MKKSPVKKPSLRKRAEDTLAEQKERLADLSAIGLKKLVHELGTHQIELEMQNEELRLAQSELEASRRKYADLYDFSPVGYITLDRNGLVRDVNHTGAEMLGIAKRSLTGGPFQNFIDPDSRSVFRGHLVDVFETQTRQSCEVNLRGKNGVLLPVQLQSISVNSGEGTIDTCRTSVSDISKLKQTEGALKKSEESYRALVEFSPEALAIHLGGIYVYANPAAVRLFGAKDMQELLGKNVLELVHPAFQRIAGERIHEMLEEGIETVWTELKIVRMDGEVLDVETDSIAMPLPVPLPVPVKLADQKPILVVFRDVTHRKKAEANLNAAHAELERRAYDLIAVNKELEAFSQTVSHDLKTPLRSIEGFSRAVLEDYADKLGEAGKDYLLRVYAASKRMTQLIDAMLNMARLTHGELRERKVSLSSLAEVIAHDLQIQEPDRRVEFLIAEKVDASGDQDMLRIVLENLMNNAWKFTSRQSAAQIEFGVLACEMRNAECGIKGGSKSAIRDPQSEIVYFVRDNGAGFDMQYAENLFQPFKRMHSDDEYPGLGIGLAIAHGIILRHGGRMWAKSERGKGATFFFTV